MNNEINYVKQQITNTLIKELEEKNINEISIRDLCNDAGVGRASFYRHFNSKEEVLEVHAYKLICEWSDTIERDTNAKPSEVFESLFQHLVDHASFYKLLYKMNMADMILKTIKKKIQLNDSLSNFDAYGKSFFAYGLYGWINEWVQRGMDESPEQLNEMMHQSTKIILQVMNQLYE